jgi:SsrA-binding protein
MSLIRNKKVHFDFEILETFEAGLELFGNEVKSLRKKQGSLEGSHVVVRGDEAFLVGATIPPYQPANTSKDYDPERTRKLLLNKKEIDEIGGAESQRGLTIVPISVYSKGRNLKLEIGIAKGKKKSDKRNVIKERDTKKDIERQMKQAR